MTALAEYIIRKQVPVGEDPGLPKFRGNIGISQGWISIFANLVLFVLKLVFGFISNSIALIADAFHTLSDMASSGVVVFGFKMASKPADKEHPFGHGRAETIAGLTISILVGFTGIEFIKTSINRFMNPTQIEINWVVILVVLITIIIKEGLAQLSYNLGERINSSTLIADAIHHRSDMWSSMLVLSAFGGVWLGYPKADGIMGLGVAVMMIQSAYTIARSAIDDLLGKPVDANTMKIIRDFALQVPEVYNVHDIVVHSYGAHRFISLHIEIAEGKSPESMHDISDTVEKLISQELEADVITHVDPVTIEGEEISIVKGIVELNQKAFNLKDAIQDLRIVKNNQIESILFQVPVPVEFNQKDEFKEKCSLELIQKYPNSEIMIEFKSQMSMR
ncbi:MAG TPA: cation diffusion facilitator family transporter [Candidatus Marinimicrobia bacterium]|jgi:cation diffusion facilitator family transporter|nr:cation diffusion facilitator family transporter [Candidatus Neomarinimicrobiota bacterium]